MTHCSLVLGFCPRHVHVIHAWRAFVAAVFLCAAFLKPVHGAEQTGAATIAAAVSESAASLSALETQLATAKWKLERLIALELQGNAAWLEVGRQRVYVASLQAEWEAAKDFGHFLAAARIRAETPLGKDDAGNFTTSEDSPLIARIALELAAARANAEGELQAARIGLAREKLRVNAVEELTAQKLADRQELSQVRRNLQAAGSVVQQLEEAQAKDRLFYGDLLGFYAECSFEKSVASSESQSVVLASVWEKCLVDHDLISYLIQLREYRANLQARDKACAAQIVLLEELSRRQLTLEGPDDRGKYEGELNRLNIAYLRALQLAIQEEARILRLEETRLSLERSRPANAQVSRLTSVMRSASNVAKDDLALPHWSGRGLRSPTFMANAKLRFPALPVSQQASQYAAGTGGIGFSDMVVRNPNYTDYYAFGIRRRDLPPAMNRGFFCGGLPWYLPGSPTNFR